MVQFGEEPGQQPVAGQGPGDVRYGHRHRVGSAYPLPQGRTADRVARRLEKGRRLIGQPGNKPGTKDGCMDPRKIEIETILTIFKSNRIGHARHLTGSASARQRRIRIEAAISWDLRRAGRFQAGTQRLCSAGPPVIPRPARWPRLRLRLSGRSALQWESSRRVGFPEPAPHPGASLLNQPWPGIPNKPYYGTFSFPRKKKPFYTTVSFGMKKNTYCTGMKLG